MQFLSIVNEKKYIQPKISVVLSLSLKSISYAHCTKPFHIEVYSIKINLIG